MEVAAPVMANCDAVTVAFFFARSLSTSQGCLARSMPFKLLASQAALLDPGVTTKSLVSLDFVRKSRFVFCSRLGLGGRYLREVGTRRPRPAGQIVEKSLGHIERVSTAAPSLPPEEGAVEIWGVRQRSWGVRAAGRRHCENPFRWTLVCVCVGSSRFYRDGDSRT